MENKMKAIVAILAIFLISPIWFFLLYKILTAINATELMWFLYWIYLPVAIIIQIISKLIED